MDLLTRDGERARNTERSTAWQMIELGGEVELELLPRHSSWSLLTRYPANLRLSHGRGLVSLPGTRHTVYRCSILVLLSPNHHPDYNNAELHPD
ncbi:hypothetical protein NQZ68_037984 [Dissostichus eleginoides]|nr:hypothetical protein NQZ68_037984 [Dissostichus eleginoides]